MEIPRASWGAAELARVGWDAVERCWGCAVDAALLDNEIGEEERKPLAGRQGAAASSKSRTTRYNTLLFLPSIASPRARHSCVTVAAHEPHSSELSSKCDSQMGPPPSQHVFLSLKTEACRSQSASNRGSFCLQRNDAVEGPHGQGTPRSTRAFAPDSESPLGPFARAFEERKRWGCTLAGNADLWLMQRTSGAH